MSNEFNYCQLLGVGVANLLGDVEQLFLIIQSQMVSLEGEEGCKASRVAVEYLIILFKFHQLFQMYLMLWKQLKAMSDQISGQQEVEVFSQKVEGEEVFKILAQATQLDCLFQYSFDLLTHPQAQDYLTQRSHTFALLLSSSTFYVVTSSIFLSLLDVPQTHFHS